MNRKEREHMQRLKDRRDILVARINDSNEVGGAKSAREWQKEFEAVDWAIKRIRAAQEKDK